MEVDVLGELEVRVDGEPVSIEASRERAVLEVLVLHAGDLVATDRLVDALWGEAAPATAAKSLQSHVSRLRSVLPDGVIVTELHGYRLAVDRDEVDLHRFTRLVDEAREARRHGDPARAARLLGAALPLWRGEPLADLAEGPLRDGQRARLAELRLAAIEARLGDELALGEHEQLVPELEALVAEHPLREPLWAHLMLALYRAGRRADALSAYGRLRQVLREELGVHPTAEIRELEAQILREDPALSAPATPPPCTLPTPLSSFVDRELERSDLVRSLREHRLITLLGPGGVGKTRLAVEVARAVLADWPDGVWWVDLTDVPSADALLPQLLAALDITPVGALPLHEVLSRSLADRRQLLVVDRAERLVDDLGPLLASVLERAPGVAALVTSRAPLEIAAERRVPVLPLGLPDADRPGTADSVTLFVERRANRGATVRDDELPAVAALCRQVDGLPLGIELTAAQLDTLPADELLAHLERRPEDVLAFARPDVDDTHTSLRNVLASTTALLSDRQRRLLGDLAVFPSSFDLAAARVVGSPLDLGDFDRLVDVALVVPIPTSDGERRYRLADTTRAFAATLVDEGERAAAAERHADHFRRLAVRAGRAMETRQERRWIAHLTRDDANLRQAMGWYGEHRPGGRLDFARGVGFAWFQRGLYAEQVSLMETMLAAVEGAETVDEEAVAWAHLRVIWPAFLLGDFEAAAHHLEAAEQGFERVGEPTGLALVHTDRAHTTMLALADHAGAEPSYRRAIAEARQIGSDIVLARCLVTFAHSRALADQVDQETMDLLDEAEPLFAAHEDRLGLAHVSMTRMIAALADDDVPAVLEAATEGIRQSRLASDNTFEHLTLVGAALGHRLEGRRTEAIALLRQAVSRAVAAQTQVSLGVILHTATVFAALDGDHRRAARLRGAAMVRMPLWPSMRRRYDELLSPSIADLGDDWEQEVEVGRQLGDHEVVALALPPDDA